jgi:hypothetical protein
MALTPGGGRSPSTQEKAPPPPTRTTPPRPARGSGPRWPRTATISVLRLGLLIGGLVIILDLLFMLLMERSGSVNAEDAAAFVQIDLFLNVMLFALLGVLVVRDTTLMLAGFVAGFFAGLLDAIVVTAASVMVPPPPTADALWGQFAQNVLVGMAVAGLSGLVFALVQRWSGGQRSR